MFGKRKERGIATLIGGATEVQGDVQFKGGIHVDGRVNGSIKAGAAEDAVLSVGARGIINGDVDVPTIVLNGVVKGDVRASKKITMSASARIEGHLYYTILEMASGASINGELICQEAKTAERPAATAPNSQPPRESKAT